jgi:hypothetical protein
VGTLQDALKKALPGTPAAAPRDEGAPSPTASSAGRPLAVTEAVGPTGVAALPSPADSEWGRSLRGHGVQIRPDAGVSALVQATVGVLRRLVEAGRRREARELESQRDEFCRRRERLAWEAVKARFAELELPERTYRALKQEGADPEKALARLHTRRAEEFRGMGAARLRESLLGK